MKILLKLKKEMNRPLEKVIYKYLQEYKKQVCEKCEYRYSHTCALARAKYNCPLTDLDEKKMCRFIATRLTIGERK